MLQRLKKFVGAICAILMACSTATTTHQPTISYKGGTSSIDSIPGWYEDAWDVMWDCSEEWALPGASFDSLQWARADTLFTYQEGPLAGVWTEPYRITLHSNYVDDTYVVSHEILHSQLGDERSHESDEWKQCIGLWILVEAKRITNP